MKKLIIGVFAGLSFISVEAQQVFTDSGNHGLMTITTKEKEGADDVVGSPYFNDSYEQGIVDIEGKGALQAYLRYNVVSEQMEIKTNPASPTTYMLPRGREATYKIGENNFVLDKINADGQSVYGYFIEHYNGDNLRVLEKPTAQLTERVKAQNTYQKDRPAEIKIEEQYYIVLANGDAENVRLRNRDIRNVFNTKPVKDYLSDNKIRSVEDLVAFARYYDSRSIE